MRRQIDPPPIWVWGVAILLGISACFWQSVRGKQLKEQKTATAIQKHLNKSDWENSHYRILVLGSSMVSAAFTNDEEISHTLSERTGKKVVMSSVALPNAKLESIFADIHILEVLSAIDPTHVFIEKGTLIVQTNFLGRKKKQERIKTQMLATQKKDGKFSFLDNQEGKRLLEAYHPVNNHISFDNWLGNILGKTARETPNILNKRVKRKQAWKNRLDSLRDEPPNKLRTVRQVPFKNSIEAGIRHFQLKNAKLICLEIPYSMKIEKELEKEPYPTKEKKAFEYLEDDFGIEIWEVEQLYPYNHYLDFVHMHDLGRERYTNWFINKLEKYLNQ
ncbi:MAG: hypothetical protein ACJAWV_002179 [Flammeovirgaceae bacterium]|jgi:hypothetical protein